MIHLPAPHHCPACNGMHRPGPILPSQAELRPYFGTYLTAKVWQGNSVATSIVFGSFTTVNFGTPSSDPLGLGSGASLTSTRGFGQYAILFHVTTPGQQTESFQMRILINGASVISETFADDNSGAGCHARIYFRTAIPAGQTIQVQAQHNQATRTVGAAACEVAWMP